MSWPQTAAFHPIFWLHHANVDRLFSLWSAVNPEVWVTVGSEVEHWKGPPKGVTLKVNSGTFPTLTHGVLGLSRSFQT